MSTPAWSVEQLVQLRLRFADEPTQTIADSIGKRYSQVARALARKLFEGGASQVALLRKDADGEIWGITE